MSLATDDEAVPVDAAPSAPRLTSRAHRLQQALQQVAAETSDTSAWSLLIQARAEPDRERGLAMLRAALERYPGDPQLLAGLAERLSEVPRPADVREAISALQSIVAGDPDRHGPTVYRDLALLLALQRNLPTATSVLRRGWELAAADDAPATVASSAFVAGLLARLQHRDDTPALAALKAALPRAGRTDLSQGVVGVLLERLDAPNRRLYGYLFAVLLGRISAPRVEALEPRFAAIVPNPTWPQGQLP